MNGPRIENVSHFKSEEAFSACSSPTLLPDSAPMAAAPAPPQLKPVTGKHTLPTKVINGGLDWKYSIELPEVLLGRVDEDAYERWAEDANDAIKGAKTRMKGLDVALMLAAPTVLPLIWFNKRAGSRKKRAGRVMQRCVDDFHARFDPGETGVELKYAKESGYLYIRRAGAAAVVTRSAREQATFGRLAEQIRTATANQEAEEGKRAGESTSSEPSAAPAGAAGAAGAEGAAGAAGAASPAMVSVSMPEPEERDLLIFSSNKKNA